METPALSRINIGDRLPNGSILLASYINPPLRGESVVLAGHFGAGAEAPFCTWRYDRTAEQVMSRPRYWQSLVGAMKDFHDRCEWPQAFNEPRPYKYPVHRPELFGN